MRNKLLYFLITLFGAATLVSGYSLVESQKVFKVESKKDDSIEQQYDDDQQPTINDQNTEKNTEKVTGYRLQDEKQKISSNTTIEPPDTPTTTEIKIEETFETKVTLQINGKNLLIPYQKNISAEGAMKEAHQRYPESFWYESIEYGGDLGTFVKSINGIAENNREKMYWILYINGNKSNKGISILKLKPDDIIMWNYEKEIL